MSTVEFMKLQTPITNNILEILNQTIHILHNIKVYNIVETL